MPTVSNKGQSMPDSPIRKLVPYSDAAKKRGVEVIHLNIGQPDIETPPNILNAYKDFDFKVLAYSSTQGSEDYRIKLASYFNKPSINAKISENDILVTSGASEALLFGLISCLDPGEEVIVPEPFYANYYGFSRTGGIVLKPISTSFETGFALPPIEDFEAVITEKTKAIMICNPNNPTGYLYSEEELKKLKHLVLKHDLFLFSDEVYREFVYDDQPHISVLSIDGLEEHAVLVDSTSKRYSACGARLGCLVSKNKKLIETALKFAQARLCTPILSEKAAEAALDTPQVYFDEIIKEYDGRRRELYDGLNKIEGVKCNLPTAAFYLMVDLPIKDSDHFCQWLLESFQHEGKTLMLAPGSGFYSTPGRGTNEVRIAYVLKKEELKTATKILSVALDIYKERFNA